MQQLQSALYEINRYLQTSAPKPPGIVSRVLDEKTKILAQLRDLGAISVAEAEAGEKTRTAGAQSSIQAVSQQSERFREIFQQLPPQSDPLEERMRLEEIFEEMGLALEKTPEVEKILLGATDIFIENVISTACSLARNREAEEISSDDILLAMRIERGIQMYNTTTYKKQREADKEHIKRTQMIKKDQKRGTNR